MTQFAFEGSGGAVCASFPSLYLLSNAFSKRCNGSIGKETEKLSCFIAVLDLIWFESSQSHPIAIITIYSVQHICDNNSICHFFLKDTFDIPLWSLPTLVLVQIKVINKAPGVERSAFWGITITAISLLVLKLWKRDDCYEVQPRRFQWCQRKANPLIKTVLGVPASIITSNHVSTHQ